MDRLIFLEKKGCNIGWNQKLVMDAIKSDDIIALKYLISKGNSVTCDHNNPLKWACSKGFLNIIKFLLENGADIHANQDIPLLWAILGSHIGVVKYLIKNGANLYADNNHILKIYNNCNIKPKMIKYINKILLINKIKVTLILSQKNINNLKEVSFKKDFIMNIYYDINLFSIIFRYL
jgi:ankyrin repeat protein